MIRKLEEINQDDTLDNMFKNFQENQEICIHKEYTIGGFQEQSNQTYLDSDNKRSIPRDDIEISGEKDMVEDIIKNKGFKISKLYGDCLAFFPPKIEHDTVLAPNTISYSSLAYFDDDMTSDVSTEKLTHNDFKDGFFQGKEIKYLDNKECHPPPPPFVFDEVRNLICHFCQTSTISLKTFADHIVNHNCAYGSKYGKILLHERLIIIYRI